MQHYSDYLREQAAKYRLLAETAEDASRKQEFLELAAVCDEVANEIDDRRDGGRGGSARTTPRSPIRNREGRAKGSRPSWAVVATIASAVIVASRTSCDAP